MRLAACILATACVAPAPSPGKAPGPDADTASSPAVHETAGSTPHTGLPTGEDSGTDTAAEDCRGPLRVTLGTGEELFTDLPPELVMVFGPQGGWHLTLAARVEGVSEIAKFLPRVTAPDGTVVAGDQFPDYRELAPWDAATCIGDAVNLRAFLPVDQLVICSLADVALDLRLEVEDLETGATAEGTGQIVARLDPRDEAICP